MDEQQSPRRVVRWRDVRAEPSATATEPGGLALASLAFALTEALRHEAPPALTHALRLRVRQQVQPTPLWSEWALGVAAATTLVALLAWSAMFGDLLATLRFGDTAVLETLPLLFGRPTASAALLWAEHFAQQASLLALAAAGWFTVTRLLPEPRRDER